MTKKETSVNDDDDDDDDHDDLPIEPFLKVLAGFEDKCFHPWKDQPRK